MRVSGCNNHSESVWAAEAKVEEQSDETPLGGAKTVTTCPASAGNNLPIVRVRFS